MQATVQAGGFAWDCNYDDPVIGVPVCENLLRQQMTHRKPWLVGGAGAVFAVHRLTAWGIITAALLSLCCTRPLIPSNRNSKIPLVDSFLSFFFDASPILSAMENLFYLNAFIYPTLEAMYTTILQQSSQSLFAIMATTDENFYLSFAALVLLALLLNEASAVWSGGEFLLRFKALVAVAMGYYAHYLASSSGPTVFVWLRQSSGLSFFDITWQMASWTVLSTVLFRGSFAAAFFWCLAHCAGQSLSEYQYEKLVYVVSARALVGWVDAASRSIERGLKNLFAY